MRSLGKTLVRAAAKAATAPQLPAPVPYSRDMPRMMMYNTAAREKDALLRAVEENSTLYSITNRTGTAVSELIWRLYRDTPNADVTSERVEVQSHAVLDLLAKPNRFMPAAYVAHTLQLHLDATGEGYQILNRAVNNPKALPLERWPVTPSRIEPVPSAKNFMNGWLYTSPDGEQVPLELWEVIPFRTPHPRDPYRGLGPVQPMITQLEASKFAAEYNRNFFLNSAQPGGIVTFDHRLGDDEWNEFVQRWNEQHRGVSRAHRVAFLENATWVSNQMTMKDMAFPELRTNARDEQYEAFGIAGSVMGVTEDVNRANAEAGKAMFGDLLVNPRGALMRDTYNLFLVPMYGDPDLALDFDSPVPADQMLENETLVAKANAASIMVNAGWDADEVLVTCELPPMKWKEPAKPPVMLPPGAQPGNDPAQSGDDSPQEDDEDENDDTPSNRAPLRIHGLTNAHDPATVDLTAVDEQWQQAIAQLTSDYQANVLPDQRAQAITQIRAAVDDQKPAQFGNLQIDSAAAAAILLAAMLALGGTAANQAVTEALTQGQDGVDPQAPTIAELQTNADIVAALLAAELAVSAGREAARVYQKGDVTAQQVADEVSAFLMSLSMASIATALGGALSMAATAARVATFLKIGTGSLYASEVLDKNTCAPCKQVDGQLISPASSKEAKARVAALYPAGGYIDCLGRDRCRGTVIWRPDRGGED